MGGNTTIALALDAGLADALTLHLTPVVLGAGTPLLTGAAPRTLVHQSATTTSTATPLTYDVELQSALPSGQGGADCECLRVVGSQDAQCVGQQLGECVGGPLRVAGFSLPSGEV